jgi:hypothetical protein
MTRNNQRTIPGPVPVLGLCAKAFKAVPVLHLELRKADKQFQQKCVSGLRAELFRQSEQSSWDYRCRMQRKNKDLSAVVGSSAPSGNGTDP